MLKWMCAVWCSGSDESLDSVKKDSPNELPQLKPVSWKRQVEGRWWIDFFTVWAPGLECRSSVLGADAPPRGIDSWEPYASACSIPAMNQAGLLPTSHSWPFRNNTQHSWLFNNLFGLAQDGSDTPGNQGDEPRPIRRPGALCPDVSRPIAPGQKASPRSTPILTPLQFLFGDL